MFLTGDLAEGRNSPFVDLVLVGKVDKPYLYQLIEKAEPLIQKKIRVGIYHKSEFTEAIISQIDIKMKLLKLNDNSSKI